jgi:regulator of replication initiation timing
MMGERNLFRAEAHAKEKEHELVSRRFLEIRLENDIVKLENVRLRDALKNIGAEVDDMMTQQKQAMKVKIKRQ